MLNDCSEGLYSSFKKIHSLSWKHCIPITTESSIMYSIPCSCGKVYIGETTKKA